MVVYVDDMFRYPAGRFGRMKMSHMIADSTDELLAMADEIGLDSRWLQYGGTRLEHFDVSLSKRRLAVEAGAVEITWRELGRMLLEKKSPKSRKKIGEIPPNPG